MTKRNHDASNAAITGAGSVTAGTGLVAGGLPGIKGDPSQLTRLRSLKDAKDKPKIKRVARAVRPGVKAAKGGILGGRIVSHNDGTEIFRQKASMGEWHPSKTPQESFVQGRHRGKVAPEEKIIREMKGGKKVAAATLLAGSAAIAYGQRDKIKAKFKKRDSRRDKVSGAALGAGGTGLIVTSAASAGLHQQKRRWERESAKSKAGAARHIPALDGMSDQDIVRNPHIFRGASVHSARLAGHLRGAAAQHDHFADVYRTTAKVVGHGRAPSAVIAGAGGVGLLAHKKKKPVSKNLSAFGVEHG